MAKNSQNLFDTQDVGANIKKKSLQGGAVNLGSQGVQFFLQLGSTMVLARILSPEDYGMMAMVVALTGFAGLFLNLGLSAATIQRPNISHDQVSALFWINSGVGALLMLSVAGFSPVVAMFYNTPELKYVALAISVNFLLNGLAVQHGALLNRQMRFFTLAKIEIASKVIAIIVAILAAVKGLGYWALVLHHVAIPVCSTAGTWIASGWLPSRPRRAAGVGSMVKFGADLVGFNVVNYFSRNLDNVLIGRFHGSGPLGLYSKAYQLLMMPITNLRNPMMRVAMPALSRLQNEPENYRNYYIKFVSILAFVSMPLVTFLFVCSDQIILIVLGDQWMEVSELFKILALAAFIQPVYSTIGIVMISTGKSRRYFVLGFIGAVVTSASFVLGLPWGAKGVAIAYTIQEYLRLFPILYFSFKNTPVTIKDFILAVYKPFVASIMMAIGCALIVYWLSSMSVLVVLAISFVGSVSIYLISIVYISGTTREIREIYNYGKIALSKA